MNDFVSTDGGKNVLSFYSAFLHFFSLAAVLLGWHCLPGPSATGAGRRATSRDVRARRPPGHVAEGPVDNCWPLPTSPGHPSPCPKIGITPEPPDTGHLCSKELEFNEREASGRRAGGRVPLYSLHSYLRRSE